MSSSEDELQTGSTTNTQTFLDTCVLDADHKALEEHLVSNPVEQRDLDRCLLRGIQIVQQNKRALSHVAPVLRILLKFGAKWNSDALLAKQKTPLHIICGLGRDYHEMLDLMIKSSPRTIIDTQDIDECTALLYAVRNANINCVRCLIANGADVNKGYATHTSRYVCIFPIQMKSWTPIMEAFKIMSPRSGYSSAVKNGMPDIFDLLFDAAVEKNKDLFRNNTEYILGAVAAHNFNAVKKMINIGAPLDIEFDDSHSVWESIAKFGNVELLKCLFNRGIDKDATRKHFNILWHVVLNGNIEAVRYLLDLGVAIPNYSQDVRQVRCEQCKENRLIIPDWEDRDPCMIAIRDNKWEIVKLLDEYGSEICKSFAALRSAVYWCRVDVISYLLNKHTYPLNIEYIIRYDDKTIYTLLTESERITAQIAKILLDHGVDPGKLMCSETSANAIMAAIHYGRLEVIAQYLRSGVDINLISWAYTYGNVSPFEASVLHDRHCISVMLLNLGCSRGRIGTRKFKAKIELEKLMKQWNVYENNVTSLEQRCRSVILYYLSPRADMKIKKLPLPQCLIKFLSIPELDNIIYEFNTADRN